MSSTKGFFLRRRINRIIARLTRRIGIQDFLDGSCEGFNWENTLGVIGKAVSQGRMQWEDTGYSRQELEYFYHQQIYDLLDLLALSLKADISSDHHWSLSRHAIYGMERFRRFVKQNELVKLRDHSRIASAFWTKTFTLLKEECPDATDDELNSHICAEQMSFLTQGGLQY